MKKRSKLIAVVTLAGMILAAGGNSRVLAQDKRITCESRDGNYNYCRVDTDNNVRLERKISLSECRYGSSWGYDKRGIWVDRGCRAEFTYGGGSVKTAAAVGAVLGGLILAGAIASRNKDESKNYYSNQEVYDLGYRDGSSDARRGLANNPDSRRYEYDSKYREDFRRGYSAGYVSVNASSSNNAVSRGYSAGAQDARNNYGSDYSRHRSQYDWSTENDFRRGYNDGYRDNRNNWSGGNYGNGDRVPNYFVGTFRGYTPSNNTNTDITIYADGSIRISSFRGDQANGYFQDGAAVFPWGRFRLRREGNGFTAVDPNNRADSVFYQRIR